MPYAILFPEISPEIFSITIGEFTFALPEGLPQGVYPVSTDLMLNGERVGDQKHGLQLVLWVSPAGEGRLLALAP